MNSKKKRSSILNYLSKQRKEGAADEEEEAETPTLIMFSHAQSTVEQFHP